MKKIAIFASGSGSNAENIISFFNNSANIAVDTVFCNVPNAYVLERAKKWNIPAYVFTKEELKNPDCVLKILTDRHIDLIVLAGFLWLIPPAIIHTFPNRIINIHPALLPAYGGKGMFGMNVHKAVIETGESESGITIHYVNEHYDKGDIILQKKCPVIPTDTPDSLAEKIHALEYRYFPETIQQVIDRLN